jgi:hypothetical protein
MHQDCGRGPVSLRHDVQASPAIFVNRENSAALADSLVIHSLLVLTGVAPVPSDVSEKEACGIDPQHCHESCCLRSYNDIAQGEESSHDARP